MLREMEEEADWYHSGYPNLQSKNTNQRRVACAECKRRKLRCDGKEPECGNCEASGLDCQVSVRHARGPKRGQMAALRKKVAELENQLGSQKVPKQDLETDNNVAINQILDFASEDMPDWNDFDTTALQSVNNTPVTEETGQFSHNDAVPFVPTTTTIKSQTPTPTSYFFTTLPFTSSSTTTPSLTAASSLSSTPRHLADNELTGFIPAELDLLYFERVHPAIPLLHRRSYFSWSKQNAKKGSRTCLQYAMWTLAALLSAQFRYLREPLYRNTTQMLNSMCSNSATQEPFDKEQAQAWLMISVYELMSSFHREAWISAGRAFRIVQVLQLHELDANASTSDEDATDKEEKRRVFWVAYFLDHLFSMSNNWSVTLNEQMICTRLLAPESDFQNSRPGLGSFLSEAITERKPRYAAPFNEAIIFAVLCGRRQLLSQQLHVQSAHRDLTPQHAQSNRTLDNILKQRLTIVSQYYASYEDVNAPMIHFVNLMAQSTIIYAFTSMNNSPRGGEGRAFLIEMESNAITASQQMIRLAETLTETSLFKIHPLSSIPLMLCADFLYTNCCSGENFKSLFEGLSEAFTQIRDIEDPNQSYMDMMKRWPSSCKASYRQQTSVN